MNNDCCGNSTFNCSVVFAICENCVCACLSPLQFDGINNFCALTRSLPGEECEETEDCIEGLLCLANFTCNCQDPCVYVPDWGSCECGEITLTTSVVVIIVGILLGFMSIILWMLCIMRTLEMGRECPSPIPIEEYNINQLRMVTIQSPIILQMQRSFAKEVSVTHGANCHGQPLNLAEESRRISSAMAKTDDDRNRPSTPDPYAGLVSLHSSFKSGYCPTAPIDPQYPVTLLTQEEEEKYLDNMMLR